MQMVFWVLACDLKGFLKSPWIFGMVLQQLILFESNQDDLECLYLSGHSKKWCGFLVNNGNLTLQFA